MSQQVFEEANEIFVDDRYEEAYEVRDQTIFSFYTVKVKK